MALFGVCSISAVSDPSPRKPLPSLPPCTGALRFVIDLKRTKILSALQTRNSMTLVMIVDVIGLTFSSYAIEREHGSRDLCFPGI